MLVVGVGADGGVGVGGVPTPPGSGAAVFVGSGVGSGAVVGAGVGFGVGAGVGAGVGFGVAGGAGVGVGVGAGGGVGAGVGGAAIVTVPPGAASVNLRVSDASKEKPCVPIGSVVT
jgi:hypothetical protein